MAVDIGEIPQRETKNFEETSLGKVKFRKDRHIKGEIKKPEGEKARLKGLKIKGRNERDVSKYLIEEGIKDYEENSDSIFYDGYIPSEDKKWLAEYDAQKKLKSFSIEEQRTPFDPAVELSKASRNGQEAMSSYKRSVFIQSRVIGEIILLLWEEIKIHGRFDIDTLIKVVAKNAQAARLTDEQVSEFERALEEFVRKHEAIERYVANYPDPTELFRRCFSKRPEGIVRIIESPMALILQCFNQKDYVKAYNLWSACVTPEQEKRALESGGAAFSSIYLPELNEVVVIENASINSKNGKRGLTIANPFLSLEIERHEEQHQFNKLFTPIRHSLYEAATVAYVIDSLQRSERIQQKEGITLTAEEKNRAVRRKFIHELVRLQRRKLGIDEGARDEVLAYYTNGYGYKSTDIIAGILTENPLYDYLKDDYYKRQIKMIPDYVRSVLGKYKYDLVVVDSGIDPSSITDEEVNSCVDQVFGGEYKRDLIKRIEALQTLEDKGYFRQEILALLYQKPITGWIAFAKRAPLVKS